MNRDKPTTETKDAAMSKLASLGRPHVRKAEEDNDENSRRSSNNKRHCRDKKEATLLKICLTSGNQRHVLEFSPDQINLSSLQQRACQLFGFSSCLLKQGFPPFSLLTETNVSELQHQDRILVHDSSEKAKEKDPAHDVVDLTANDNDEDVEVDIAQPAKKSAAAPVAPPAMPLSSYQAPFGTFNGRDIYRNKIGSQELRSDGHYAVPELVLPNCTATIATTFDSSGEGYMNQVFAGVPKLLVVTPSSKDQSPDATIGKGLLWPMVETSGQEWHWLYTRPHTGGCLHAKLLLFRSPQGLRVVVSGNNLIQHQWQGQRDVLWIQDFPILKDEESDSDDSATFGDRLESFLRDLTRCADRTDQTVVHKLLQSVLSLIDFSDHQANFVYSFPREKEDKQADRGGYKQLAQAVASALQDKGMTAADDSVLFATSGSMGNLQPNFLWQMHQAMEGTIIQKKAEEATSWDQVDDKFRCFWPSASLACQMDMVGLHCLRHMPAKHLATIPKASLRKILQEARPNPPDTKIQSLLPGETHPSQDWFYPTTHGKFLWSNKGVLYLGSHNFSQAAWGLRGKQPQNVELGVVLVSPDAAQHQAWIQRLPCALVDSKAVSPATYKPYVGKTPEFLQQHPFAPQWQAWEQGQASVAIMAPLPLGNNLLGFD